MDHVEEGILELYVLGSDRVEARRAEIGAHLKQCAGCAKLAEEIAEFYRVTKEEVEAIRASAGSDRKDLVPSRNDVAFSPKARTVPEPFVHSTPVGRFRYFVFQHPIISGGGAVAFGAAAFAVMSLFVKPGIKDTNPAYAFPNTQQSVLEIRNQAHEKLWALPVYELKTQLSDEHVHNITRTIVTDLNGDGKNEVLTTLPLADEHGKGYLRIFDSQEKVWLKEEFICPFSYRDRQYTPRFDPSAILVLPTDKNMEVNLFIGAKHESRSPFVLSRRGPSGKEIGQYWHFGNLLAMDSIRLRDSGKMRIILGGINDTADTTNVDSPAEFPVIVVLDPEKVVGQKKSVSATGFGFPESDAEVYYIRLPLSDMEYARKVEAHVDNVLSDQQNDIAFGVQSGYSEEHLRTEFMYIFGRNMLVKEVKVTNMTETVHARLVEEGKITSRLDKAYLENLKNGVRYWDGREWRREPVRINHVVSMSKTK